MKPTDTLAALEEHLRDLRRTNANRLLAAKDHAAESLERFISLQNAIEAVQRAARDETAMGGRPAP